MRYGYARVSSQKQNFVKDFRGKLCAALGLPGRLTIRVRSRMPAADRESIARGVICILMARIASGMPGTILLRGGTIREGDELVITSQPVEIG